MRRAFTLIELLVVVAIVAALAAILFPVLSRVREQGNRAACLSNIRQLGMALTMYVQDNDGFFPPDRPVAPPSADYNPEEWVRELTAFIKGKAYHCPSCPIPAELDSPGDVLNGGYGINGKLFGARLSSLSESTVIYPATTTAFCESAFREKRVARNISIVYAFRTTKPEDGSGLEPGYSYVGLPGGVRHNGGSNYVFVDGHARWYTPGQVKNGENPNDGKTPAFAL